MRARSRRLVLLLCEMLVIRLLIVLGVLHAPICFAQPFDLLVQNGLVFDPKNSREGQILDIGVVGDRIVAVQPNLNPLGTDIVVDATGSFTFGDVYVS